MCKWIKEISVTSPFALRNTAAYIFMEGNHSFLIISAPVNYGKIINKQGFLVYVLTGDSQTLAHIHRGAETEAYGAVRIGCVASQKMLVFLPRM